MWSRTRPSRLPPEPDRRGYGASGGRTRPAAPAAGAELGAAMRVAGAALAAVLVAACASAPAGGDRAPSRCRSSREQIALSFAPVVRQAAPAVVNIYTTQAGRAARRSIPVRLRPVLRLLLRGLSAAQPRGPPEQRAGLGRDRARGRPDRHQPPRDRGRRGDHGRAVRPARVPGRSWWAPTRPPTSRCCDIEAATSACRPCRWAIPTARGRRSGARDRQPVRHRPDRDQRHRLGARPHHARHRLRPVVHPDRRRDQPRQLRRRAGHPRWRLVGINTAIFTRSGGSIGIGFAIPVNLVKALIRSVEGGGEALGAGLARRRGSSRSTPTSPRRLGPRPAGRRAGQPGPPGRPGGARRPRQGRRRARGRRPRGARCARRSTSASRSARLGEDAELEVWRARRAR